MSISVHYEHELALENLSQAIYQKMKNRPFYSDIIILCIGTDRSTGDALGPLIGSKLLQNQQFHAKLYGHLDDPVHAMNLAETVTTIKANHQNPFIIAVDACLGKLKSVGLINLNEGPLKPGAGVKKELPEVGDMHITGIVNVGGFMEYFVLQNTRLNLVMKMADVISSSLYTALQQFSYARQSAYELNHGSRFNQMVFIEKNYAEKNY